MTNSEIEILANNYCKVNETTKDKELEKHSFMDGYDCGVRQAVVDLMFLIRCGKVVSGTTNKEIEYLVLHTPKRK